MDTKLIRQYGEDILCYRHRAARKKKRMQYEDFDKQLIHLHKEERQLSKQKRNLGWEALTPPIQRGWKRFFVLREDVARSKHKVFFENILQKINTYDFSWRKDFKQKKRIRGRKIYVVKPQSLLKLSELDLVKLEFNELEKQFFYEAWETDCRGLFVKRFVFKEPWRFVLRVKPNMVDKVRKRDNLIEARLQEIDDYLSKNRFTGRLNKILHGSDGNSWLKFYEKEKEKYRFKNKSLNQILNLINEQQWNSGNGEN
ncbi:hypothetical protein [Lacibacter sediminis]|uniref:Uncharacterized protein n=1 Tax=Lacibacter sediminis TaxID=2760713 RepID=A0A7G5XHK2_9BACT|nr:hypothetical protein [Lacibacter sediminis]QNA44955.1 hypothetical protein H4075_01825 [Lacibacter sediminis]